MAKSNSGLHLGANLGRGHTREDVAQMQDSHQQALTLFRVTGERAFLGADDFFVTTLNGLNGSGITGEAILAYDRDTQSLTVAISASGVQPNQTHIQHIHGFPNGTDATTPTLAQDDDGDGYIELLEGVETYGPVMLNLATNHDNMAGTDNGHSHTGAVGFPTAPDGTIWFIESYALPAGMLTPQADFTLMEIIIHGMSVPQGAGAGTTGEVNGSGGYKLILPVAAGELTRVESVDALRGFIDMNDFHLDAAAHGASTHGDLLFG